MPASWRKLLFGLLVLLAAGAGIGWIYGHTAWGLLTAALIALFWQVRQLLAFDRALRTNDFDAFRYGEGIWQQIFARFSAEHDKARAHQKKYRTLLREIRKSTNAMPDGAVIIDDNFEIQMCNRAAKRLAGFKPKKDRGQRVDNILRDPDLTKLLHSKKHNRSIEIPSPIRAGDWLNCRIVPYGADQKMLLLRDVTERMRVNRMRRDFFANASHELRSPLTVISGYLDSLADEEMPEEWRMPVSQMQSQALRMNKIIAELLELSRLESAGPASTSNTVDVAGIVAAASKAYSGMKGVAKIETDADPTLLVLGNSTQIESVVTNLVSNAIRHTPPDGTVTVRWRRRKSGAELVVSDTGEGIAEDQIPRVTERFFRVDRGRARTDGGVGLGLAIVKHVLNRHDAELKIESKIGQGSQFRCLFPPGRITKNTEDAETGQRRLA
jgi:two-component system phosphate regulon sensor histidine kinase PhoR